MGVRNINSNYGCSVVFSSIEAMAEAITSCNFQDENGDDIVICADDLVEGIDYETI